jgi:hypothetical protein
MEEAAAITLVTETGAPAAAAPTGMVEAQTVVTALGTGAPTLLAVVAPGIGAVAPTAATPTAVTAQGARALSVIVL